MITSILIFTITQKFHHGTNTSYSYQISTKISFLFTPLKVCFFFSKGETENDHAYSKFLTIFFFRWRTRRVNNVRRFRGAIRWIPRCELGDGIRRLCNISFCILFHLLLRERGWVSAFFFFNFSFFPFFVPYLFLLYDVEVVSTTIS